MTRALMRWGVPGVIVLGSLGLVGWPAMAQRAGPQAGSDVDRAREMAALIAQGQLNLRDASTLAEKHIAGTALEAKCTIEGAEPRPAPKPAAPGDPEGPGGGSAGQKEPPGGKRLVYEVSCFAKDRLQTVRVDGLSKRVLGADEHK